MSVSLGPFALPLHAVILLASAIIFVIAAKAVARRSGKDANAELVARADRGAILAIAVALIIARLAFVIRFWPQYSEAPLQIINIRDGGFNAQAGWFVLAVTLLVYSYRFKPLLRAYVLGSAVALSVLIPSHIALTLYTQGLGMPDAEVATLSGNRVSLHDFASKPMVVNYWASWCPPCRREMPVLEAAQDAHPDVQFVFVNQGETVSTVQRYLKRNNLELDNVLLDRAHNLSQASGAAGLPTTLFFDAQGQLIDMHMGEISQAGLRYYLEAMTATPH